MNDWQPIETAPRDGSRVLCWGPSWDWPGFLRWFDAHPRSGLPSWEDASEYDQSYYYNVFTDLPGSGKDTPTHWFPIPAPPSGRRGAGQ
jgi:hypothetical protein